MSLEIKLNLVGSNLVGKLHCSARFVLPSPKSLKAIDSCLKTFKLKGLQAAVQFLVETFELKSPLDSIGIVVWLMNLTLNLTLKIKSWSLQGYSAEDSRESDQKLLARTSYYQ